MNSWLLFLGYCVTVILISTLLVELNCKPNYWKCIVGCDVCKSQGPEIYKCPCGTTLINIIYNEELCNSTILNDNSTCASLLTEKPMSIDVDCDYDRCLFGSTFAVAFGLCLILAGIHDCRDRRDRMNEYPVEPYINPPPYVEPPPYIEPSPPYKL